MCNGSEKINSERWKRGLVQKYMRIITTWGTYNADFNNGEIVCEICSFFCEKSGHKKNYSFQHLFYSIFLVGEGRKEHNKGIEKGCS